MQRIRLRPLRWWWVAIAALLVVVAGVSVGWTLWLQSEGSTGPASAQAHADAIRTGLATAGGTGAALALLLAVRRQRSTELALDLQADDLIQKEQVASVNNHDATERRITELYTKAVEQLGNDKALVRLGGLHALERLAHDNRTHRQTIVDVLCAYLRMPYTPADQQTLIHAHRLPASAQEGDITFAADSNLNAPELEQREQERQVRQTAQRILASHLKPYRDKEGQPSNPKFWPDIDIDLTGAYLIDFAMNQCELSTITCNGTIFSGETTFRSFSCNMAFIQSAEFIRHPTAETFMADFRGSKFSSDAWFSYTTFAGKPLFNADEFFAGSHFNGHASFKESTFCRGARFDGATFEAGVNLTGARTRVGDDPATCWPEHWVKFSTSQASDENRREAGGQWHEIVTQEDQL
ncbi:pentapeptide repeat-containing protein [Amycolatopsis sp. NPDC024027]|uniref:pentapeptide repeat-containing protein n=1 Tax=Amycolatopsis sp. NPDC024027 TaxID=3154327 RepID=UPI00340378A2